MSPEYIFIMATAQNAEGIILRKFYLRETSYIIVLFTREFGKIKGVIKGVRNPYPQFAGNFEIFTQCQVLFYRKKKRPMDLITHCEALDFFLPVRKDIERLTFAGYFVELIDIVTADYDVNEGLYQVLVDSLRFLATKASAKRVSRVFELKLLGAIGLSPQLEECAGCGALLEGGGYFSVQDGGALCAKCGRSGGSDIPVSLGTVNFMRKIQSSDMNKTYRIKVSKEVGKETEKVLRRFLQYHISRQVKSLVFLEQLKKKGMI
ncbi:MAG: DNA repair protein RecO [Candidatus Omnitrophota bacterium]|nr:DNA repair protein RecO [Candidatus Omnitrophota bacterium]